MQQSEESHPSPGSKAEVVQVAALRQGQRAPAPSEGSAEASGALSPAAVGVQHAPHHVRAGEPAQALRRKGSPAGGKCRQAPADRGEPVEDTLRQEGFAAADDPLETQNGALAGQTQVFDIAQIVRPAPDQPDRLAAAQLRNDDPPGEALAQRSATFARFGAAQQAEVLGDPQPAVAAQVTLQ